MLTPTPHMDETLLTAFALGELDSDPDERDRVAAHLESDDEARRFVDEVRESAGLVGGALGMELADGLNEFQHERIERRLRELDWEPQQPLRFRPATMPANGHARPVVRLGVARGGRLRQWLPTLASVAASILIVAGGVALFLRFDRYDAVATNDNGSNSPQASPPSTNVTPAAPDRNAVADDGRQPAETDSISVADTDDGPVQGMVDPKSVTIHKPAKKAPAKPPAPVASSAPKKAAPTAPAVAASTSNARLRTMRSAEAVEAKRMSVVSAYVPPGARSAAGARGPRTVNASPARDGVSAAEQTPKSGASRGVP
jgi:hypothetical protein